MEKLIAELDTSFRDIREKSFKNIDTKIRHIDDFRKGNLADADIAKGPGPGERE